MQESEGLGSIGWGAVVVLLLLVAAIISFGFSAAIYFGLIGTVAMLGIIIALCLGDSFGRRAGG